MATEKIESLISAKALAEFDQLNEKINKGVALFEKLVVGAAELNRNLGSAKSISDINKSIEALSLKVDQLTVANTNLTASQAKLKTSRDDATTAQKKENDVIKESLGLHTQEKIAINDTVNVYNKYKMSIAAIQNEMKGLKKLYGDGKISLDQYQSKLVALRLEEERQKVIVQSLGTTIKQSAKESVYAAGSAEQLRAKLALLTRAYDALNSSQRSGTFGKQIQTQIKGITAQLTTLEAGTGRFQRNVGNYTSAFGGMAVGLGRLFGITSALIAGQQIFTLNRQFDELNKSLELVSGTTDEFARNQTFLSDKAEAYGLDIQDLTGAFRSFYAAATNAGLSADQTRNIFDQVSKVAGNLKLSQENVNGVLLAFSQIASKGKVQAEELRGQIGERVPGAFAIAAKAMGVTTQELNKMMEMGQIASDVFLPKFAAELERTFGKSDQIESLTASVNRFFNEIKTGVVSGYLINFLTEVIDLITKSIKGWGYMIDNVKTFFKELRFGEDPNGLKGEKNFYLDKTEENLKAQAEGRESRVKNMVKQYELETDLLTRQKQLAEAQARLNDLNIKFGKSGRQSRDFLREQLKDQKSIVDGYKAIDSAAAGGGKPPLKVRKGHDTQIFDEELRDRISSLKKIADAETFGAEIRMNARRVQADAEIELLNKQNSAQVENANAQYEQEKQSAKNNAGQLEVVESDHADKMLLINTKYSYDKKKINQELQADLIQINRQNSARLKEVDKDVNSTFFADEKVAADTKMALLIQNNEKQISIIERTRDIRLKVLEDEFTQGLVSEKKYAEERAKIEREANIAIIEQRIKFTEALIATADAGTDTSKLKAELANLKLALSTLFKDSKVDEHTREIDKWVEGLKKVNDAYNSLSNVIGDFISATTDKKKNAVQDEIDVLDKRTQAEIEAVNQTTLSQQEKADRIAIINARSQAQKEQLERRQRLLDTQRARFDKAQGIGNIIIRTAMGVTSALAQYPPNVPLAIAVGALGAAQLAVAIATPIPKFAKGTTDAPGGWAMVGDGGKSELVVTPDGRIVETPSVPTVMQIPRHSVIHPDSKKVIENDFFLSKGSSRSGDKSYYEMVGNKLDKINSTIKNKKEIHLNKGKNGWDLISKNGSTWTKYLNDNI